MLSRYHDVIFGECVIGTWPQALGDCFVPVLPRVFYLGSACVSGSSSLLLDGLRYCGPTWALSLVVATFNPSLRIIVHLGQLHLENRHVSIDFEERGESEHEGF